MTNHRFLAVLCLAVGCVAREAREAADSGTAKPMAAASDRSAPPSAADSARAFTQAFYDWYVPLGDRLPGSRYDSVVVDRASMFAPTLLAGLKEDLAAQARSPGEIVSVGGDYDPYLNSQDPCGRYEARDVVPNGAGYAVSVYGLCSGREATLDVIADLEREGHGWVFTNFRMPNKPQYDLLSQLKAAKAGRDSTRR
jgi:hypothetical protein